MKPVIRSKRRSLQSLTQFLFGLCCLAIVLTAGPVSAAIYYVRTGGGGNGASWQAASSDLAGILDSAESGDQIWVAEGAYKPTEDSSDRTASFFLKSGVALYGGFSATGDPDSGDRDPGTYITVLTGDIDDNDSADQDGTVASADGIFGTNSYHVVFADSVDETAILDGFVVTGGKADNENNPHGFGGGMVNSNSCPAVTNCTFSGNGAFFGGGMYNESYSDPMVTNCMFTGNASDFDGGGMYNEFLSDPTVTNCTFSDNQANGCGGGMVNWQSSPAVTNCTFSGNGAGGSGGGMVNDSLSDPTVTNCTFSYNQANGYGGGMYNNISVPTVTNCIFWDDEGSVEIEGYPANLTYCVVRSGDVAVLYVTNDNLGSSGDIALQSLADNGGPTMTCALGAGSIAIDAGTAAGAPATDQRGVARPYPLGGSFDIGAYEYAEWKTVTVSAHIGGAVSVDYYGVILSGDLTLVSKDFTALSTPTFVITPEESMDLTGVWFDSEAVSFEVTGATVTLEPLSSDHTLEATFAVRTFSVTTSAGAGGTVFPSGTTSVNWGDTLNVDITPYHGYTVSDVLVGTSQGAVTSYTFSNIQADGTLHVAFAPDQDLLHQGGLESLSFPGTGGAAKALMAGTASVDLPEGLSGDSFSPVVSVDLGGFWLETVDSGDVGTEVASADPGATFLCGVSFDVVASEEAGVGLLALDLELVVSEDSLSTGCLEAIATDEDEVGLAEAFLTRVAILKVLSDDVHDLFDVALDSGSDPLDFFTLSRDEGSFLVGLGLLIADTAAGSVDAVQAVPASGDCRFLVFDGMADGHFRDPLVAVEKDLSTGGDSGCNALPVSGIALLLLPLLGLLKKR